LLECVVAIAIFVAAGLMVLGSVSRSSESLERSRDAERAADLARSAMAKIESGLARPETLIGPVKPDDDGIGNVMAESKPSPWSLEIETEPSQFTGLTHVTVKAVKKSGSTENASYTLHQLVRLFGGEQSGVGEEDPLAKRLKLGGGGTK
jgi:hypothetical protein